jgi:hypothetical protein
MMYEFRSLNCLKVSTETRPIKMRRGEKFHRGENRYDNGVSSKKIDKKIYDFLALFFDVWNL